MVRFLQFALSGFFAGIGGGLYATTYEIVTYDALAAPLSGNGLLMAYIGGGNIFVGPILLAVLGFVGLVELLSFLAIGAAEGKTLALFGRAIDANAVIA